MSSLYTQEEIDEFKNYANNLVVILPNESEQYSRLTTPQISDSPGMANVQVLLK